MSRDQTTRGTVLGHCPTSQIPTSIVHRESQIHLLRVSLSVTFDGKPTSEFTLATHRQALFGLSQLLLRPQSLKTRLASTRPTATFAFRPPTTHRLVIMAPSDTRPIVISGPSGVGKGTLYKMLFERHPETFTLSVSHTTRKPRAGEQDGVDYFYVTMEEFESLIEAQGFVEHAKFGSNRYGTSKKTIEEQSAKGKVVVLDIEIEGVKQVRKSDLDCRYVFLLPPSVEELEARLRGRGTETEESIKQRLDRAKEEIAFNEEGGFDKTIVNNDLKKAYEELEKWVYRTE